METVRLCSRINATFLLSNNCTLEFLKQFCVGHRFKNFVKTRLCRSEYTNGYK